MADYTFSGAGGKFTAVQLPWSPTYRSDASFAIDNITESWLSVSIRNVITIPNSYVILVDIECSPAPIGAEATEASFIVSMIYTDEDGYPNETASSFSVARGAGEVIDTPSWEFPYTGGNIELLTDFTPQMYSTSDEIYTTKNGDFFTVDLVKSVPTDADYWLIKARVNCLAGTPSSEEVNGTFNIICKNGYGTFSSQYYRVMRGKGTGLIVVPIWLDRDISVATTNDYINYRIDCDGETIYEGRCYRKPNDSYINFNINKICANYIDNTDLVFISGYQEDETWSRKFEIYDTTGGSETLLDTLIFTNDYSYDYSEVYGGNMTLNKPINNKLPYGAWIPFSFFNADTDPNSTVSITDAGGSVNTVQITTNNQYNVCRVMENNWYECLGVRYELDRRCADYVLYYANAYGGWDALAFYGKCQKSVDYQRFSYDKSFSNALMTNYETNSYQTNFKTYYELNTGWLTDEQSEGIENLIGSNRVYMHDMKKNEIKAVVIEDTSMNVQKFLFTGKMNNYTITVRESQERVRR